MGFNGIRYLIRIWFLSTTIAWAIIYALYTQFNTLRYFFHLGKWTNGKNDKNWLPTQMLRKEASFYQMCQLKLIDIPHDALKTYFKPFFVWKIPLNYNQSTHIRFFVQFKRIQFIIYLLRSIHCIIQNFDNSFFHQTKNKWWWIKHKKTPKKTRYQFSLVKRRLGFFLRKEIYWVEIFRGWKFWFSYPTIKWALFANAIKRLVFMGKKSNHSNFFSIIRLPDIS